MPGCTRFVLDDERLLQDLLHVLRDHAPEHVVAATRRVGNDDANRLRRIRLRERRMRNGERRTHEREQDREPANDSTAMSPNMKPPRFSSCFAVEHRRKKCITP
jgi:hypothetical protein